MKKRRKHRYFRLIILLILLFVLVLSFLFIFIFKEDDSIEEFIVDNNIDYSRIDELDIDLYSRAYLLIRLNDGKALYGDKYDSVIYPASLTKVLTMNTLLSCFSDLDDVSSFSTSQYYELINENASMGGLVPEKMYSLNDLLYYLILPSGADAALAISNYFDSKGLNLVDEMNKRCEELHLSSSFFTNPTGLHDDNMYTSLKDLSLIYIDTLKYDVGKKVLKTAYNSDFDLYSTLFSITNRDDNIVIFGGKTGYTDEAHQNIIIFYEADNRSYILLLANADGNASNGTHYHFEDVNTILDYLYN